MYNQIPPEYLKDFLGKQAELVRSRVNLFCVLVVGIYIFASAISYALEPGDFKIEEIPATIFFLAGSAVILHFNKKSRPLRGAILNAYFFTALVLAVLTRINIIYHEYADYSSTLYIFVLFLVSFTIPWPPLEVIIIALMHVLAYTFLYVYIRLFIAPKIGSDFDMGAYIEGIIFILTAFIICIVLRRKETARDIENFTLLKEIESKNIKMRKELELATQVHKTLVPKSISTDLVDIAVLYLPAYYLGGDYAKFHFIDKDKLIFVICDVTGHGVSAALLVNRLHTEFESLARDAKGPGVLLKELNDFIVRDFSGINMYLSAFCGLLDFRKMKFIYSNHGHPPQYFYKITESKVLRLAPQSGLLGLPFYARETLQGEIEFGRGDKILLFTDGVIEARNPEGVEYGKARIEDFIDKHHTLGVDEFNHELLNELSAYSDKKFKDDIFILSLEIK